MKNVLFIALLLLGQLPCFSQNPKADSVDRIIMKGEIGMSFQLEKNCVNKHKDTIEYYSDTIEKKLSITWATFYFIRLE